MGTKKSGDSIIKPDNYQDEIAKIRETRVGLESCQFVNYPAKNPDGWFNLFLSQLQNTMNDPEWTFYSHKKAPLLLGSRLSKWDSEIFGFNMAVVKIFVCDPDIEMRTVEELLDECLADLGNVNVKFITTRIYGDLLPALHAFENKGFNYYENMIWAVASTDELGRRSNAQIRLMEPGDLDRVMSIAEKHSYARSHYKCDTGFDTEKVRKIYGKRIKSFHERNQPIAVLDYENEIMGYLSFSMDDKLSEHMGCKYGRLQALALDPRCKGKGLGAKLFKETLALMKDMGAEYIDSSFASKNYLSSRLHTEGNFYVALDEVTYHLWL